MPWCPKCKAEYQEGFHVCSDCNVELVETLEEEKVFAPFFQSEEKSVAVKLMKYFEYSGLKSEIRYDEETEVYVLFVPEKQHKQAKKLYQAFYFVERERLENEASRALDPEETTEEISSSQTQEESTLPLDESVEDATEAAIDRMEMDTETKHDETETDLESTEEDSDQDPSTEDHSSYETATYVMKADQYKDYNATVWVFLLTGIVGIAVVILNIVGVLSIFNGILPTIVMSALFLFFIYIGISTHTKAKKIQAEIEEENNLTEKINLWLKENITDEFLASQHNDSISKELNYIKITETIKQMLKDHFGNQNPAYLDRLIEEFYTATFEEASDSDL